MMIADTLKSIIYSNKIKKTLSNKAVLSDASSGKIGLIIDAESFDSKQALTELYKSLEVKKSDFKIVVFGHADRISEDLEVDFLKPEEISYSGHFKMEAIRAFTKEKFEFLICYFSEKSKIGYLLAAETSAAVKIGNSPDTYAMYDVEIQTKEINAFEQQVLKYIKIIKNNN